MLRCRIFQWRTIPDTQIECATKFCMVGPNILWVRKMDLASCHFLVPKSLKRFLDFFLPPLYLSCSNVMRHSAVAIFRFRKKKKK